MAVACVKSQTLALTKVQVWALGSIMALTDGLGQVRTQYNYSPFGETELTGEPSDNPFQYTGRENDGTGLYYYRARYYSATLRRFITEDPIKFLSGINFYRYVTNNPVNIIDYYGLGHPYSCEILRLNCELECSNNCEKSQDELETCAYWCKTIGFQHCIRCNGRGKYPDNPYCKDRKDEEPPNKQINRKNNFSSNMLNVFSLH